VPNGPLIGSSRCQRGVDAADLEVSGTAMEIVAGETPVEIGITVCLPRAQEKGSSFHVCLDRRMRHMFRHTRLDNVCMH
jgi:hypothetical protein